MLCTFSTLVSKLCRKLFSEITPPLGVEVPAGVILGVAISADNRYFIDFPPPLFHFRLSARNDPFPIRAQQI